MRILAGVLVVLVLLSTPAWAPEEVKPEIDLSVTGYYRIRGFWLHDRDNPHRTPVTVPRTSRAASTPTPSSGTRGSC